VFEEGLGSSVKHVISRNEHTAAFIPLSLFAISATVGKSAMPPTILVA
jgi:hypothetical protein